MGRLARDEEGFGLIELLIALTVLSVGILALFGAFNAGALAIRRASNVSTAAALADQQMEGFRAMTYTSIGLVGPIPTSGGWMADPEHTAPASQVTVTPPCPGSSANQCMPSHTFAGTDGHLYELDTYVALDTPQSGVTLKKVTVTARDGKTGNVLSRETSTFAPGF